MDPRLFGGIFLNQGAWESLGPRKRKWEFPKIGVPYFGVLLMRILLFRVLNEGPLFSETPISSTMRPRQRMLQVAASQARLCFCFTGA